METVGIEPTSADACETASTSVAGPLDLASRSPSRPGYGRPAPLMSWPAPGALAATKPVVDARSSATGPAEGDTSPYLASARRRGRTRGPHLWFSRLFY